MFAVDVIQLALLLVVDRRAPCNRVRARATDHSARSDASNALVGASGATALPPLGEFVTLRGMTYRDDRDADQARIAALEAELARAQDRIDELEGKRSQALVLAGSRDLAMTGKPTSSAARWFGAPLKLQLSRTFEGALAPEHFEDLVERIRQITEDPGRTELMRSSMSWWSTSDRHRGVGPFFTVTVTARNDVTVLTLTDRLGQLAGALYGGVGGGVGGGAIVAPIFASIAVPVLTPVFVVGWLGGIYAGVRAMFRRSARRRAERLQLLFDALVRDVTTKLK